MSNIEDNVGRAWNPVARPFVTEAWRAYNAGATRAAIAATWTAVTADLIDKVIHLADSGDGDAGVFRAEVEAARAKGISADGVRAMQAVEAKLLSTAEQLELIDSIGVRELERIREDRNLCVHPSLRHLGEVYEPRAEVARAHLAVALETLLTHPPTQGRKVLKEFTSYVCDPLFSPSSSHLQATFFDRVRVATRRNIVEIAAKHAICELPVPPQFAVTAEIVADRMAEGIKAFAARDRGLVRTTMASLAERFRRLDGEIQMRALARFGDQDFFWDMVDQSLADRLDDLVAAPITEGPQELLPATRVGILALVRDQGARERLPSLATRFVQLERWHRAQVAAFRPAPYFTPFVEELLAGATTYRFAASVGQSVVVPHGPYYSAEQLRRLLFPWWQNEQCRVAAAMPGLAVDLLAATAHLGDARYPMFRDFLAFIRTLEPKGSSYSYDALEAALLAADQG